MKFLISKQRVGCPLKINKIATPKELKEIAASIRELATVLEARNDFQCVQEAILKKKKVKGRLELDIAVKFSLVEESDIKEVGEFMGGLK